LVIRIWTLGIIWSYSPSVFDFTRYFFT